MGCDDVKNIIMDEYEAKIASIKIEEAKKLKSVGKYLDHVFKYGTNEHKMKIAEKINKLPDLMLRRFLYLYYVKQQNREMIISDINCSKRSFFRFLKDGKLLLIQENKEVLEDALRRGY